ncbi:nucleotide exchange factor GrpE [Candidatus Pelagibacter communis]|uniref:nucleotide exchange factor GrpE n=1 Tax=Pelagibacter ubique TaxID=198252 RepID=UPI00094DE898|nr:nucleotide exchange factor GrpE [Candidatus Pelagibacter ubique]
MPEEKNTTEEIKEDLNKDKSRDNKAEEKKISPDEKIAELEDKLTRSFAELENQRKRFEKEKDEAFDYGGMVFARDALNLLDNLERSKQSINNDQNLDENSKKKIMDHIEIILNDTLTIFKKNNIVPIVSINEKLDPNKHQAMMEIEDDSKDPGTIVQEIQKGFMLKDRLLRPSLVGVSKKPQKTEEKEQKK